MLFRLFVALLLIHVAESLMCYQCADSSEEDGRNDCRTWIRTQRHYRKKYEEKGVLGKYVKNCTEFVPKDGPVYCMIASVELAGGVRSFIRGCSNGDDFFGADYNEWFKDVIQADNQTACVYTGQGYVACVTLCGPEQGDFCNGFISAGTALVPTMPWLFLVFIFMYFGVF